MVRSETSRRSASSWAVMRPLACKSKRSEMSRSARKKSLRSAELLSNMGSILSKSCQEVSGIGWYRGLRITGIQRKENLAAPSFLRERRPIKEMENYDARVLRDPEPCLNPRFVYVFV